MERVKRMQTRWMTDEARLDYYIGHVSDQECWEWRGSPDKDGYGKIMVRGKNWRAHRWVYEMRIGPIKPGLVLDHLCNNPCCVNPSHLSPTTNIGNVLRGEGAAARNKRKTSCIRGHIFDEANTYIRKNGNRACRGCDSLRRGRDPYARRRPPPIENCPICGLAFHPKTKFGDKRVKTCSFSCGQKLRYRQIREN